jgi:hypothetical protein
MASEPESASPDRGDPETRGMFDPYYMVSPGDVPDVARRLDRRGASSRHTSP